MHSMLIFMLILAITTPTAVRSVKRKNIVFVIFDDLRPALGCYGDEKAHTPNMDLFSEQSVLFHRAYAQQALCAPSRNSLLTSRRPDSLGLYDFYSYWREVAGNYTSLPQHLKNNGYTTASFGKVYHPGPSCNHSDDSPYSWTERPFHPPTERYKDAPVCPQRDSPPANNLICPVRVSEMPNATLPDLETLRAVKRFLNRQHEKPFFLAVGFQKPHIPLKYPKKYLKFHRLEKFSVPDNYEWPSNVSSVAYNPWTDLRKRSDVQKLGLKCPWEKIPRKYAKKIIQSYYAAVTYVDDLFGELLRALEDNKTRNETIVILTSDHGWSLGEHSTWAKYSNFEVALRVPLLVSIPRVTFPVESNEQFNKETLKHRHAEKAEVTCRNKTKVIYEPVELLDIFPTIAELADVPILKCLNTNPTAPDLCSEGSSLVPLIKKTLMTCKTVIGNNTAISQYPRPGLEPTCEPSSDEPRLKCITIMGYTIRTNSYRYTAWVSFSHTSRKPDWREVMAEELYDHKTDFEETINLVGKPAFKEIKCKLKSALVEKLN